MRVVLGYWHRRTGLKKGRRPFLGLRNNETSGLFIVAGVNCFKFPSVCWVNLQEWYTATMKTCFGSMSEGCRKRVKWAFVRPVKKLIVRMF